MLSFITKRLVIVLPLSMLAGFLFGIAVNPAPLKALVLPLTFALVYPMMIGIDIRQLFVKGNTRLRAAALGHLVFPGSPYLQLGLLAGYQSLARKRKCRLNMDVFGLGFLCPRLI
ncbi:MAG: hypothetical protein WCT14_06250 [Treponemataceae bacterium]